MEGLMQCEANYIPLTPISFLERAAKVYPDQTSIIHGDVTYTWKVTHERCMKLACGLSSLGICYGDFVVALIPNIPELYELHFGVALAGGILSTMNPSLETTNLFSILEELKPKFIFVDHQYVDIILQIINLLTNNLNTFPQVVLITSIMSSSTIRLSNYMYYNELLDSGPLDNFKPTTPNSECDPITVSYTFGSTGRPKGVIYSHRETYLNTIGEILRSDFRDQVKVVYLWTIDMFGENGWEFRWVIAALGGINVFPSNMNLFDSISTYNVTHLLGYPSILSTIIKEHHESSSNVLLNKVYAHIVGLLPPCDILNKIVELGFAIVHRNGMTKNGDPSVENLQSCNAKTLNNISNLINNNEEFDSSKYPTAKKSVCWDDASIEEVR